MARALVTVVETGPYLADAERLLTSDEREHVVNMLAADPECGDIIRGGGGVRKVRVGFEGRGKRGGARVIYFFCSDKKPIYLFAIFAKNQKADLAADELKALARICKQIARSG